MTRSRASAMNNTDANPVSAGGHAEGQHAANDGEDEYDDHPARRPRRQRHHAAPDRLELHDHFYGLILERIRRDRYPSVPMLELLERNMLGHEREELVSILLKKLAAAPYPSIAMLQRVARLAG